MLTLYSTEGCHLCEMALELITEAGLKRSVEVIDIAGNDELFIRYGVTIPVVKFEANELNWPFDLEQLKNWLDNNGITYST
ncbi:glutaredoxin family protein [Vibrio sp. SCSIO 43135]|uniref:glutaredoxin family protein n=1 Tax=Vibrio sp. SCSIO 43135 TaxID=2819096 RepID=UPI00207575D8|nr:glutaredoxin family protein [Vibrio sp. SCSIO 43135]USD42480.1 glutaredoxin family protein [Vibrio sp. SCSIO 43135]